MGIDCPHCTRNISFFSKAMHGWRQAQVCPHCARPIRQTLNFSRFFILAFMLGLPVKLLGLYVEQLAFLQNVLATAVIVFVIMLFCLRFTKGNP